MLDFILNFFAGTIISLVIFLIATCAEGIRSFSAPFFLIFVGLFCGILSIWFGYLGSVGVLVLYMIASVVEVVEMRKF